MERSKGEVGMSVGATEGGKQGPPCLSVTLGAFPL